MPEKQRTMPPPSAQAADDWQVEGTPAVIQVSNSGRWVQNTLRKIGKQHTKNVRIQAVVCASIRQTMIRPVVLAFQHTMLDEDGLKFDLPFGVCLSSAAGCHRVRHVGSNMSLLWSHWRCVVRFFVSMI